MVRKYIRPDIGSITNDKQQFNQYTAAAYDRKRSINELPLNPDPNILHQFASYNTLFTLSALSSREIRNPKIFFKSKPHDIIARSGGIGDSNFSSHTEASANLRESRRNPNDEFNKLLDKGRTGASLGKASRTFKKDRDIYFKNVELISVPGLNAKARLTSVTNIKMELVEPSGITLIEKIKAAAANNKYLDHLDAPYLLTVEFKGFDENGKQLLTDSDYVKRVIPIKLITMDIDVNQGGSYYNIQAVPYNEFALTNVYMYPRTSGTLRSNKLTLRFQDAVQDLQNILNDQNEQESQSHFNEFPDRYDISISDKLDPGVALDYKLLQQADMTQTTVNADTGDEAFELTAIKFSPNDNILMTLENLMKTHPLYGAKAFNEWKTAVENRGTGAFQPNEGIKSHFKYFRIRTGIEPTSKFDTIRQTNSKIIKIVVEPFYISAYNLGTAGITQDKNYRTYVAKAYNYIFTGDNVDILDLNINYKVAYYQSRLKDLEANEARSFAIDTKEQNAQVNSATPNNREKWRADQFLVTKSEVGLYKSTTDGRTGKGDDKLDAFFDAITNPTADMVVVNMEILGDPAWLGQSQFIPATPTNANGSSNDNNIDFFRGGETDNIWNAKLKCFNYDVADPVINLTFKTPQDFDDKQGVYELSSAPDAVFSGLYRVTQVAHNFTDGRFSQNLTMVRFNNQDGRVTPVTGNEKIVKTKGVITKVAPMGQDRIEERYGTLGSS